MLDEYFNPPQSVVSPVPVVVAPRDVDIANNKCRQQEYDDLPDGRQNGFLKWRAQGRVQLKKALKRRKRETSIHKAGGSSKGADFESKVPDEPKGKSIDTSKGTGLKPVVPDVSKEFDDEPTETDNPKISDDEEETQNDKFVHTPKDYVPTNDETNDESNDVTEEEYERINEELYGDVNISNQVKDDAQATQKTDAPTPSSSISSDYAAKFLKFDNIPSTDTEVISMMDITVQHEVSPSTSVVPDSETLAALQLRVTDLEKDVKEIKDVDNSTKVISTIQCEVPKAVKEYLRSSLDDAMYKVIQRNFANIIKEHSVLAEIMERLKQQYSPQKSIEDIREIKMEHARKQQVPKEPITSSDTIALAEFDQRTTLFETII
ncbi:hypothetical protein Tco_1506793, partial [Tanacetum coccineum]